MNAIKLLLSPYPFVLFIISKMFSIKKYLKKNPRSVIFSKRNGKIFSV